MIERRPPPLQPACQRSAAPWAARAAEMDLQPFIEAIMAAAVSGGNRYAPGMFLGNVYRAGTQRELPWSEGG
jgi:hypothetical protein